MPVQYAVVFMTPLDVETFVEFVRLVDLVFFDINCNFEQHVVSVVFAWGQVLELHEFQLAVK